MASWSMNPPGAGGLRATALRLNSAALMPPPPASCSCLPPVQPDAVNAAAQLLDAVGRKTVVVSETPKDANLVKLSSNFLSASVESLGEAMALVAKGGVDRRRYLDILTSTAFDAPICMIYGRQPRSRRPSATRTCGSPLRPPKIRAAWKRSIRGAQAASRRRPSSFVIFLKAKRTKRLIPSGVRPCRCRTVLPYQPPAKSSTIRDASKASRERGRTAIAPHCLRTACPGRYGWRVPG